MFLIHLAGTLKETFIDSQLWLDFDCESDLTSVNGGLKERKQVLRRFPFVSRGVTSR
ncbi:hypothetical protein HanXRQr2_Chr04g0176241 [Helianthus annuus]|nr:hypothetical protein HanXRQr2_Chr04g0176241 [Helianthus annuus]